MFMTVSRLHQLPFVALMIVSVCPRLCDCAAVVCSAILLAVHQLEEFGFILIRND